MRIFQPDFSWECRVTMTASLNHLELLLTSLESGCSWDT
jgi:hypothetical protein